MTLYINGYSNTNFQKFVDFAVGKVSIGKKNTIARLDKTATGLGGHVITAHTEDGVGGLSAFFRSQAKQRVNNETRESFRLAISSLFGGGKNVPESVWKAMKLGDYGQGKPLTAHRIMVVKKAVDKVKQQFDEAVQKAKNNAKSEYYKNDNERNAQIDTLISKTIASCMTKPDLLDVVVDNMAAILVGGDGKHRTEAAIRKKINGLKQNYMELRQLALNNPSVLEPGKFFIAAMNGKTIPKGMIKTIVEATKNVPINALTKLSTSSSAYGIHKAMNQFRNDINDVMNKADVENLMDGTDEKVACRDFATQLIIARCGKGAARKMQAALESTKAAKVMKLYDEIGNGGFDKDGMSEGLIAATKLQGDSHKLYLNQMKQAVDMVCGIQRDEYMPVVEFEGEIDYAELEGDKIFTEITEEAQKHLDATRENYLKNTVQGMGKGVKEIRDIIEKKLGPDVPEPREVIRKDARVIAKNIINWALVIDCKRFAEGKPEETMFYKALTQGMNVKLPGDKKMSNDFATACDELAQFVTRNANATYAKLDDKTKAKVHIVMSLLTRQTMKAATQSNAIALDPNKKEQAFDMMTAQDESKCGFTLEMDNLGGLFVKFEADLDVNGFKTMDGKTILTGEGSKYNSKVSLQMTLPELDRLAELDYTQFDEKAAENVYNTAETDNFAKTVNSFEQKFKLDRVNTSCDTAFDMTLK
ncbi:MAG: hypothetical protein IKP58_05405 [Victivallales bacterium]|nr:hypothetical protein [Victivallales bacterium]